MRPDFLCLPRGSIVRLLFVAWALWLAAAGCSAASGHTRHAPAAAAEPAQPASAARRVLRRWAKAASITAKTCSRSAAVPSGSSWRTSCTRAESTLGTGQKIWREIRPAWTARPYQAAFTLGPP